MPTWTDDEIRDFFDRNPNVTVARVAIITMKSKEEIMRILLRNTKGELT